MLAVFLALFVGLSPAAPGAGPVPFRPLAAPLGATVGDSLTHYYAQQDTASVDRLYRRKARTLRDRLLCRYRLFPMTLDDAYLRDIPSDKGVASARDLALISALWAYKAANSSKIHLPTYGRRSERILNRALELDPDEPYALLVKGQSLFYKPSWFGGDMEGAKETFEELRRVLQGRRVPGIHPFEADVWIWMAVRKLDAAEGRAMRQRLLAKRPPPLFRQFLIDPP